MKKLKLRRLPVKLVLCLAPALLAACMSSKDIIYFQPKSENADQTVEKAIQAYVPRIEVGDILSITVNSINREASDMFNLQQQNQGYGTQGIGTISTAPAQGFKVDGDGNVALPLVGKIPAAGKSSDELSAYLTEKLSEYLESPTVAVRIANFKVSVMGEVAKPAVFIISDEKVSLPEAIALAGDMTVFGKKKNVLVIRTENGQRSFARIDMTKRDMFDSPYFYLHSGDIVYVEAVPGKMTASDRAVQLTPLVFSSLTLIITILSAFSIL